MSRQGAQTIIFAMAVGAIAVLEIVSPAVLERALYPLTAMTASAVSFAFGLFDVDVARSGFVFAHSDGFAYEIYYRCTGFWPVLLLAGLITADGAVLRGRRRAIPVSPRCRWATRTAYRVRYSVVARCFWAELGGRSWVASRWTTSESTSAQRPLKWGLWRRSSA